MKNATILATCVLLGFSTFVLAQPSNGKGPRPTDIPDHPQAIGEAGIAWYTTWETGLAEAKRSNRPIFFMSAATTCSGISGVFWPGYSKTQNSLFATEEFIKASRKFVCVRIETFENKQSEKMVRELLNGSFANTAFCIFDPQGKKRLSRTGRSPSSAMASRRRTRGTDASVVDQMNQIATKYSPKGKSEDAILQDFHSFRQALNVASADQRLLILVNADDAQHKEIEDRLKPVFADQEVVGKFHLHFANQTSDENWSKAVEGDKGQPGIVIIHAGKFGLDGTALKQLPVSATANDIKTAMLNSNKKFAKLEDRKSYSNHVAQGRRERIFFENEIPYGEDRDGDGEIDRKPGRRSR